MHANDGTGVGVGVVGMDELKRRGSGWDCAVGANKVEISRHHNASGREDPIEATRGAEAWFLRRLGCGRRCMV